MVRLSEILKKEEISRLHFDEDKADSHRQVSFPSSDTLTPELTYQQLLSLVYEVFSTLSKDEPLSLDILKDKLDILIEYVVSGDDRLLRLVDSCDSKQDYLVVHSVNVCILSLEIAKGLGYAYSKLRELALGAILHDIGMVMVKNILDKDRQLYNAEYEEVKNHTNYGVKIAQMFQGLSENVVCMISEHHERHDASGYPSALRGEQICECARIVGIADVYEALVHSRPHREKMDSFSHQAIKELVSSRSMFDPYIFRVFLERLTKHPAFMLWLATDAAYQILEESRSLHQDIRLFKINQKPANRPRRVSSVSRVPFYVSIIVLVSIALTGALTGKDKRVFLPFDQSIYLNQERMPLGSEYDFVAAPESVCVLSLDMPAQDLSHFDSLAFKARISADDKRFSGTGRAAIKVEIENVRNEKSQRYIQDISAKWKEFHLALKDFSGISGWSGMVRLAFYLEPWNVNPKRGTFYVDEVRFVRRR